MLRSSTLSSAARERHSLNWERRRSATPFYQQEWCGSGLHFFEESSNMSGPLFPLFYLGTLGLRATPYGTPRAKRSNPPRPKNELHCFSWVSWSQPDHPTMYRIDLLLCTVQDFSNSNWYTLHAILISFQDDFPSYELLVHSSLAVEYSSTSIITHWSNKVTQQTDSAV